MGYISFYRGVFNNKWDNIFTSAFFLELAKILSRKVIKQARTV